MTRNTYANRQFIMLAAGLFFLFVTPLGLSQSWRYGSLKWQRPGTIGVGSETTAEFQLFSGYRRSDFAGSDPSDGYPAVGDIILNLDGTGRATPFAILKFGDGTSAAIVQIEVTAIDKGEDWLVGVAIDTEIGSRDIVHEYPGDGPWIASITNCCRDSALQNCAGSTYAVQTFIDFQDDASGTPDAVLAPIVFCEVDDVCVFSVPAADFDPNSALLYRFATRAEFGDDCWAPYENGLPGMTLNPTTGEITWDTSVVNPSVGDLWTLQVVVEERDSQTQELKSQVSVDFILKLTEPTGTPPVFDPETPCGEEIKVLITEPVDFDVTVTDSDPFDIVSLNVIGLPEGATLSPELPKSSNPVSTHFSWVPGPLDIGSHVMQFIAEDSGGHQVLCDIVITVEAPDSDLMNLVMGPDVPVEGGDTLTFDLSEGEFLHLAFIYLGAELGDYPFGDIELDLIPDEIYFIGVFPQTGQIYAELPLEEDLPPEFSGLTLYGQGASIGVTFSGGVPILVYRKSNLDSVIFAEFGS